MRKCVVGLCVVLWPLVAEAALTLLTGPSVATHVGNLVVNGSFENGSAGPGAANFQYWASGTTSTPFSVPPGWTSSGTAFNYAVWGSDNAAGPYKVEGSAPVPDGVVGLYFGNGIGATSSVAPTFNPDGTVSFPSAPTFSPKPTYSSPVTLIQSVLTNTNPAASYILSFWVSGEDSGNTGTTPFNGDGIFGLKVTNVLGGDPIQYLAAPSGLSALGSSHRFEYSFVPLNPSLPVDIEFINPGHFNLSPFGGSSFTTEVVLDDVIVNAVPEPSTIGLVMLGCLMLCRRRAQQSSM